MAKYRRHRKPHRIRRRKSIFKRRSFWSLVFGVALFGVGVYFFIFSDIFQIKDVVIAGHQRILPETIESIAKAEIDKKILLFQTKSIFLVDADEIRKTILQKFPQIGELEIKKSFPNVLNLALAERKEVGIFCKENICFLLDGQGVIFDELASQTTLLKFQNQTLNRELTLGEKVFDKETLDMLLEIDAKLKSNLGIFPDEISLVSSERLNVRTSEGWQIYFNIKKDLNWQMASLATVLEKRIPLQKRKNLEYIDLRFNKIFVYPVLD